IYRFITGNEEFDPSCMARDVVIVKINETVLAVPREYRPVFHALEGKKLPYAPGTGMLQLCQREGEPPIGVRDLWISPDNKFGKFKYVKLMNIEKVYSPANEDVYYLFKYNDFIVRYPFYPDEHNTTRDQYEELIREELTNWQ